MKTITELYESIINEASADDFPFTKKEMIDLGAKHNMKLRKGNDPLIGKREVSYLYVTDDNMKVYVSFNTNESKYIVVSVNKDDDVETIDVDYKGGKISIKDLEKAIKELI